MRQVTVGLVGFAMLATLLLQAGVAAAAAPAALPAQPPTVVPRGQVGPAAPAAPPTHLAPPTAAFLVQQLTPQATGEVQQGVQALSALQQAVQQYQGRLAGFVQWAAEYRSQVQQAAQACQARTYSAADNASAGCTNYDTPASCERKLLDWCMNRNARFKPPRDAQVQLLKNTALQLQGVVTQRADQVYPQ